jgi:hypothetical protein
MAAMREQWAPVREVVEILKRATALFAKETR